MDDYGCDWLEDWRYLRWRSIMDRVMPDALREAYSGLLEQMSAQQSALWGMFTWDRS